MQGILSLVQTDVVEGNERETKMLIESSKLAQARINKGFTQAQVAEMTGVERITVFRWEKGTSRPYDRHIKKLCHLSNMTVAELGLADVEPEARPDPVHKPSTQQSGVVTFAQDTSFAKYFQGDRDLRLQCIMMNWMYQEKSKDVSLAVLQYRLSQEPEEDNETMTNQSEEISRREALRRMALLPVGVEYFGSTPRTTDRSEKWAPEDALVHYAAAITACEHLSKGDGEDISLAYGVLTTYLDPLKKIVDDYSQHRIEAARLVAQALLVKATLSLHREGPKRAINYGKQACIYSKVSENVPLRLATLKRLAWMYACNKQEPQALDTMLKAQSLLQKQQKKGVPFHPSILGSIYGGVAKYQAQMGQEDEAINAIQNAKAGFFSANLLEEANATVDDFNESTLVLEDGLTCYHLDQYEEALQIFGNAIDFHTLKPLVPASSERVRLEIINNETLASLKRPNKDMELSINLWRAGIQGAVALRSEQRFQEAVMAYNIMQALWPEDKRIKEMRDLARHW
jgi:transcriptional regulator with XRE-family HTH domain/tetratricopeptide (TPR) repeat protein